MNGTLLGGIAQAWHSAGDLVKDRRQRMKASREFGALDANDARRILSDIGMNANDFVLAMSNPLVTEDLLSNALAAVGIDANEFAVRNAAWLQDMQRTCSMCRVRTRCRQIQARGEFKRRRDDFCPNAGDLEQILAAQGAGARRA